MIAGYKSNSITLIGAALMGTGVMIGAGIFALNESLVSRTFATYTLQLVDVGQNSMLVPTLGVALLVFAFLVNVSGNRAMGAL